MRVCGCLGGFVYAHVIRFSSPCHCKSSFSAREYSLLDSFHWELCDLKLYELLCCLLPDKQVPGWRVS